MRWLTCVLLFFTFSFPVLSQAPVASYEGQPVGKVDLVTDPSIDVESLRHLVQQKPGQPYSNQRIQATIQALDRTGIFKKVDVEARPEAEGLHVIFVMEPAYYYGVTKFPGAEKIFTYTRLLQVADLPDQDAYTPKKVDDAQSALLNFFHSVGYFQARVSTSTELDKAHGLANVFFHVQLGKRAKIGQVEVQGPPPEEARRLLESTRSLRATVTGASLKTGKTYTPKRVNAGVHLLQQYLIKHNHLASRIQLSPPRYHPETNRADFTINVNEGPTVAVRIAGARLSWLPFLSGRNRRKLIPLYQEGAFDNDLVEEGKRNLIDYFQGKGYADVKVNTVLQRQPDKISLTYNIDKGKKHKLEQIVFRGNQHINEDELTAAIPIKKKRPLLLSHGKFSDKLVRDSVKDLKSLYQDRGFEEVSITPEVVDKEPRVVVTFQIAEGPQTVVDNVEFQGNCTFDSSYFTPQGGFLLRPRSPFSPRRLSKDRGQITAVYLDNGFLRAEVKATVNRHRDDPHRVDVVYNISEGQQVGVNEVVIAGEQRTRPKLISKTADLWTETPLSQGKMLQAESELYNLGVFDWASVGPRRPITDQTEEETVVKVHEAKRNSLTWGLGVEVSRRGGNVPSGTVAVPGLPTIGLGQAKIAPSEQTFASPRGSLEFTRRNLRGLAETGAISLLLARLDQRLIATYSDPHFRGTLWRSLLSLSGERTTENPLFAARLENASVQLERYINRAKTVTAQVRYSFQRTDLNQLLVPALVLPEDRHVRLSSFSGTLIKDTRDKPLDAHRGLYQTADLGITGKAIGSSANFARFLGQMAYYKDVGLGIVWANSIRLGLSSAFGNSDIPTSERFFSGGGNTLRGFPINGAGPQRIVPFCSKPGDPSTCANITVPIGGNHLFVFNSEMRFPLPIMKNLGGVLFYDGGNVYRTINLSRFIDNFSNTVGFGIRYATPVGPVRFDIGRNLNPVPGFRAIQFFITLGQAF
jgi:outer membrane protein insertion porin family